MKRIFDIFFSIIGLLFLLPLFIIIAILIVIDSRGGFVYKQSRVGKNNRDFTLLKFRTMVNDAEKKGLLTVGKRDSRITTVGYYLRNYKLDELPQLWNVLKGDMSLVGPRPEVRKYVDMYAHEYSKILSISPGITDYASIEYINENELLHKAENPEEMYIKEVLPAKLKLNLIYLNKRSFWVDFGIIWKTIFKI